DRIHAQHGDQARPRQVDRALRGQDLGPGARQGPRALRSKGRRRVRFNTRWTAVMIRGDDGKWRLRAIHFGTNHLDNPVLTKVRNTLTRDGIIGAIASLLVGLALGWWIGRMRGRDVPAAAA